MLKSRIGRLVFFLSIAFVGLSFAARLNLPKPTYLLTPQKNLSIDVGRLENVFPERFKGIYGAPDCKVTFIRRGGTYYLWLSGFVEPSSDEEVAKPDLPEGSVRLVGPSLERLSLNPVIEGENRAKAVIRAPTPTLSDIWIAGAYFNEKTKELLTFHHTEDHADFPEGGWYGINLLMTSKDLGESFTRVGAVWTSSVPKSRALDAARAKGSYFIGPNISCISTEKTGRYLYMYSVGEDPGSEGIWIARSRIDGEKTGRPGTWMVYYKGDFSESALGGKATPILRYPDVGNFAVSYNKFLDKYILVMAREGDDRPQGIYLYSSDDGIKWSSPRLLVRGATSLGKRDFVNYPAFFGVDANWDAESGKENWLYYTYAPNGKTDNRRLVRRKVILKGN